MWIWSRHGEEVVWHLQASTRAHIQCFKPTTLMNIRTKIPTTVRIFWPSLYLKQKKRNIVFVFLGPLHPLCVFVRFLSFFFAAPHTHTLSSIFSSSPAFYLWLVRRRRRRGARRDGIDRFHAWLLCCNSIYTRLLRKRRRYTRRRRRNLCDFSTISNGQCAQLWVDCDHFRVDI